MTWGFRSYQKLQTFFDGSDHIQIVSKTYTEVIITFLPSNGTCTIETDCWWQQSLSSYIWLPNLMKVNTNDFTKQTRIIQSILQHLNTNMIAARRYKRQKVLSPCLFFGPTFSNCFTTITHTHTHTRHSKSIHFLCKCHKYTLKGKYLIIYLF